MSLHFATNQTGLTREITHAGRSYLVAPVVALRAGVVNGKLVSREELAACVAAWSGSVVTLGHPQANGEYVSANTPDTWALGAPGQLWNAHVDNDALKGDLWLDVEKSTQLGEPATTIINRLRAGQPLEVSTGYFADQEPSAGVWNGIAYQAITRHIRPDHLALLPDTVGACSWQDGCGTPRVNEKGGVMGNEVNANELPLDDQASLVRRAFRRQMANTMTMDVMADWEVIAVFAEQVIAQDWASKTYAAYGYTLNDGGEVSFGEAVPVQVVYRAKQGGAEVVVNMGSEKGLFQRFTEWLRSDPQLVANQSPERNKVVNKTELVAALVANERCKFAEATLNTWAEGDLQTLQQTLDAPAVAQEAEQAEPQTNAAQVALPPEITAFAQMIANLGGVEKLQAALGSITANADAERVNLLAELTANSAFTADELAVLPTAHLHKLAAALQARDYSAGAGSYGQFGPDEEELAMPSLNGTGGGN
jgi:hypothetical protein